ncbi:CDP-glycerol glycerophosphotransferase family protein [Marinospirillum perlucidum]|uniref:CDP-glycerol glycerophosphotransferase family protein n=1 Tax=Marinospirillum perlucidum TaxID=1982602 RepID=UPI001C49C13C|nr:CDP-glycerol glycerophosphotransferase family protein [Marinospirillum perlucidum]
MQKNPNIKFDTPSLYYIPQYEPVLKELEKRGVNCELVIHKKPDNQLLLDSYTATTSLPFQIIDSDEVLDYYQDCKPDWILFGNGCSYLKELDPHTKTALLYHGIGVKSCYYDPELAEFDLRFTEGQFRQEQLQQLYPQAYFVQTGFAKLDPLAKVNRPYSKAFDLASHRLDPNKPTLVYAPTFYPSSIECLPINWPQELNDCNIIIKPHLISYTHKKYAQQRERFHHWANFDNVYLAPAEEISLLPYMATADLLISEASSALFEFAALDKPVIWLDFLKLRWSYRGPLRFRFEKRMDQTIHQYRQVATHVNKPSELAKIVKQELKEPLKRQKQRAETTQELIGDLDGQVSVRIATTLLDKS